MILILNSNSSSQHELYIADGFTFLGVCFLHKEPLCCKQISLKIYVISGNYDSVLLRYGQGGENLEKSEQSNFLQLMR